jgi:hypothetical protein
MIVVLFVPSRTECFRSILYEGRVQATWFFRIDEKDLGALYSSVGTAVATVRGSARLYAPQW